MTKLDNVKIESTFRINATSVVEAAKIAASDTCRALVSVNPVNGESFVFIAKSEIDISTYYDVLFVDAISDGKYRVETAYVDLCEYEYILATGGDEAVNSIGFYADSDIKNVISSDQFNAELAEWVDHDIQNKEPGRMEGYYKNKYKKVAMKNGKFEF